MEVNDELLDKLAGLAKLNFNDAERVAIKNDLQKMIRFVQKIESVDTAGIEPLEHMADQVNAWREDEVKGSCSSEEALKNAAKHNEQFFMVPKVIKK